MTCSGFVLAGGMGRDKALLPLGAGTMVEQIASAVRSAAWNLIVACDMPHVPGAFLEQLIEAAASYRADCLIPETGGKAIHRKLFKMQDFISTLRTSRCPHNVNTPSEWSAK